MTSVVFSVLAAFAVFTLCTRKHNKELVSALCCCLFLYTTVFAGTVYLPARAEENLEKTEPARLISELLYNESASPVIVAYNIGSRNAGLIQFLNLNTRVAIIRRAKNIPDNCIIIADEEETLPLEPGSFDYIGTDGGLSVYAKGETARDYMRYKRSADITALASEGVTIQAPMISDN